MIGGRIELVGVELRATTSVDADFEPTPLAGRVHTTLGLLDRLRRARHTAIELSLIGREPPIPILAHHIEISSGVPQLAGGRRHRDVGDPDVVPDGPQLLTQRHRRLGPAERRVVHDVHPVVDGMIEHVLAPFTGHRVSDLHCPLHIGGHHVGDLRVAFAAVVGAGQHEVAAEAPLRIKVLSIVLLPAPGCPPSSSATGCSWL